MAKLTIPMSKLPPLNINNDTPYHIVRFRMVSNDKNVKSAWTPMYYITPNKYKIFTASTTAPLYAKFDGLDRLSWGENVLAVTNISQNATNTEVTFTIGAHNLRAATSTLRGDFIKIKNVGGVWASLKSAYEIVSVAATTVTIKLSFTGILPSAPSVLLSTVSPFDQYDLYCSWDNNEWFYLDRVSKSGNIDLTVPPGATNVYFSWQRLTTPTVKYDDGAETESYVTVFKY